MSEEAIAAVAADDTPLSPNDADALLAGLDTVDAVEEPEAEEVVADAPAEVVGDDIEIEDTEADTQAAEEVDDEAEEASEVDDDEVDISEPEEAVAAPQYLGADDRAIFDQLTPDAKALFLRVDGNREAFTTRKSQELTEARKAVEARQKQLSSTIDSIGHYMSEAERAAKEWDNVDWVAAARELTPQKLSLIHI